jgi:uncharacterized protein
MLQPPPKSSADFQPGNSNGPISDPFSSHRTNPWLVFALPLGVFMLAGVLEPKPDATAGPFGLPIDYSAYPAVYTFKIALTMAAMAFVWPGYRQFPWKVSPLAFVVGAVGVVVWVGLSKLHIEHRLLGPLGLDWLISTGRRSAFNPLERWADEPLLKYGFLAIRFWGLAIVIPIIEEFFLRGLLMRFFLANEWWKIPFGILTPTAVLVGTLFPVLMHPAEMLAAAVWFSLVTWLMHRTRNIWDCVAAHVTTNLLLGIWIVTQGDWFLW